MPRRALLAAALMLLLATAVASTSSQTAAAATAGSRVPLGTFAGVVASDECIELQRHLTARAVYVLIDGWLHSWVAANGGRLPEYPSGRSMWSQLYYSAPERAEAHRLLDRVAARIVRTHGATALGECVGRARPAPAAIRVLAEFVCLVPGSAHRMALIGAPTVEDRGPKCMRKMAGSVRLLGLAQAQSDAAASCYAQLTAGTIALRTGPVTFGSCVLRTLQG